DPGHLETAREHAIAQAADHAGCFRRFQRRELAADREAGGAHAIAAIDREPEITGVLPDIDASRDTLFVQQLREPLSEIVEHAAIFAFASAHAPGFEIFAAPSGGDRERTAVGQVELQHRLAS